MLDGKGKFLVGCSIVALCFAITAMLFLYKVDMPANVADVLKVSIGVLFGWGSVIVGYYWGGVDKPKEG